MLQTRVLIGTRPWLGSHNSRQPGCRTLSALQKGQANVVSSLGHAFLGGGFALLFRLPMPSPPAAVSASCYHRVRDWRLGAFCTRPRAAGSGGRGGGEQQLLGGRCSGLTTARQLLQVPKLWPGPAELLRSPAAHQLAAWRPLRRSCRLLVDVAAMR